jgi:hypothetical protein
MRRLILALALLALVGAGCGADSNDTGTTGEVQGTAVADTEGIYLDINHLKYQIEMSRYMNANDVEDSEYLKGLPAGTPQPNGSETWFGVWMRVQNVTDQPRPAADNWEIRDTLGKVYHPIPLDTNINVFAFQQGVDVPPNTVLPLASSAAGQGPIQGSLLLFKVTTDSLQNRPLELRFTNGQQGSGQTGVYDLDV